MSKPAIASLLTVFAMALGYWLGEHHFSALPVWQLLPVFALAAASFYLLRGAGVRTCALVAGCCLAATVFAWLIGSRSAAAAFNQCVADGEGIRVELAAYRQQHGHYPSHLKQLGSNLPCQLFSPPQFLQYSAHANSYVLSFSDAFVVHRATDTQAFFSSK
ncbi:hypothetical protein [Comamonas sp. UBA7528]|jgi:hypothetical protein|uniref:hypothetical protein n=1 Tax=Comamonas sp. UBA7528 TaxID=1946391 RepID=UPI0025C34BE7|nr:hypothetical protein [Comamonas sp. UBA7528]